MSYGAVMSKMCPGCSRLLDYVDYTQNPPPIPPGRHGYARWNHFLDDEGRTLWECPTCEADLEDPELAA